MSHDPFPQAHAVGGLVAAGAVTLLRGVASAAADARDARAINVWSRELSRARGNAVALQAVAEALADEVSELEAENARLRRALRQRDEAFRDGA